MKISPIAAKDFKNTVIYAKKCHIVPILPFFHPKPKSSWADKLNKYGAYLFQDQSFDYSNMKKNQIQLLNSLVKLGLKIMEQFLPEEEQKWICINTIIPYLTKSINTFYRQKTTQKQLEKARLIEDSNYYCRPNKIPATASIRPVFLHSDICRDYMPRSVKSQLRKTFYNCYNVYPENIFIAFVFCLTPYHLNIKNIDNKRWDPSVYMLVEMIDKTIHKQKCGSAKKNNISQPDLNTEFDKFEQDMLAGKYKTENTLSIQTSLQSKYRLSRRQADSLIKRFNIKHKLFRITGFYKKS